MSKASSHQPVAGFGRRAIRGEVWRARHVMDSTAEANAVMERGAMGDFIVLGASESAAQVCGAVIDAAIGIVRDQARQKCRRLIIV